MYKKILVSRLFALAALLAPCSVALAEDLPVPRNTQLTLGVERIEYTGSFPGVGKVEEESGSRGVVGIGWSNLFIPSEGVIYRANLSAYGGIVDYTCVDVGCGPGTSTSNYAGLKFEGIGGYRFGSIIGVEIFSGMGADMWYHGIQESSTIAKYDEYWMVANAKLGMSVIQRFNSFGYFLRVGVKAPFYAWNHVELYDGADFKPVPHFSGFAELNLTFGTLPRDRFVLTFYYDSYRFGRSKAVDVTSGGVLLGAFSSLTTEVNTIGAQMVFGF